MDMNNTTQGRKGGTRDTWWKNKHRNSLEAITSSDGLNTALAYLLEEQHNVLETCQGDLEAVLVYTHLEDGLATNIVSKSLAMRICRDTLH